MELGGVNRASTGTTPSVVTQSYARVGESSAAPDLSPEKTVQAVEQAQPATVQISDDATASLRRFEAMRQIIDKRVTVDPATRQLLFQAVRQRTGEVIQQTPTEVSIKLRAYLATASIPARNPLPEPDTDEPRPGLTNG